MTILEGHCFCGAICFQVEGPETFACFCYCDGCQRPGQIDITLNALDDSDRPELRAHIFTEDKAPWMMIGDELPVYAKNVQ